MAKTYPLNPVVSSNTVLASNYNGSMESAAMMSECLTPHQLAELVESGARFRSIVLVNGEGKSVLSKLGDPQRWDPETLPRVKTVWLNPHAREAVAELCDVIGDQSLDAGSVTDWDFEMG